jgi:NAD(P)-dependent dehydrogenase (short-subunit alcohol dehydrogenase family)
VTGAGRGLGLAISRRLGQAGAAVVLAEVDRGRGQVAADRLNSEGFDATFVAMDVADPASVDRAAEQILADAPVDGLVNNAALADAVGGKLFWELPVEVFDRLMAVNARGPWLVSRAFAAHLIERGRGRIVNLASDAALYGSPRLAHYIASKGAVVALTRAMARDLGPYGVTVNAVAPGLTVTDSTNDVPVERHELYRHNRAIPRDQQPEDVVGIVGFLLGQEAGYITGQLIVVNGGFVFN